MNFTFEKRSLCNHNKTILIYGAEGWIGQQVIFFLDKLLDTGLKYFKGKARVDNVEELEDEMLQIKPSHVLCIIGRTHGKIGDKIFSTIDYLEQDGKLVDNVRDNLFSPIVLAQLSQKFKGPHLTYFGTGCIFEYDESHLFGIEKNGFLENSNPNFFGSSYSIIKGFTDRLMHLFPNVLNLRIRMPINSDKNSRNFITKITSYEKTISIPNSMTVLPELIPIAIDMMLDNLTGTINLVNPGLISHNEILEIYKEIVDPNFEWKNFSIEEMNSITDCKRSNNYLDTSKLKSLYPEVLPIKESVRMCLLNYPKPFKNDIMVKNEDLTNKKLSISKKPIVTNNLITKDDFLDNDNTNILITGGCGFIGSNFINYIHIKFQKIKIINIDTMYYCASENNVNEDVRNSPRYTFIKGNLCSKELIDKTLNNYQINFVVHFAAQSCVDKSFSENSTQFSIDNFLGTHTLLESARIYNKLRKFIYVSTDEVYGPSATTFQDIKYETSNLQPTNPYAATKAGADLLAQSYIHSYKMPIIITRSNNIYGPNQYPEKIIPLFIKLLNADQKVTVYGKGEAIRSFINVKDVVRAFEIILLKGVVGEIYNIGCDLGTQEYTVLEISRILIKLLKNTDEYEKWISFVPDRPLNDARYLISNDKIKKLGWESKIQLMEGLSELIKEKNI
jgi:dTDP-glucose 4,6-dehydratase